VTPINAGIMRRGLKEFIAAVRSSAMHAVKVSQPFGASRILSRPVSLREQRERQRTELAGRARNENGETTSRQNAVLKLIARPLHR